MGLLDVLNSDQGRLGLGLLAAAGGRSDGAGFGQRMAEGLGSYDHWKKQQAQAKLQKMQEEEMQAQVEARKAKAVEDARIKSLIAGAGVPRPGMGAGLPAGTLPGAFDIGSQVPALEQPGKIDFQGLMRQGVPFELVKQLADAENLGRQKVARTTEIEGPNGQKIVQGFDDYGQRVGQGENGYVAPVIVNQGGSTGFQKPVAGASFPITMSPGEKDASARGWASNAIAKQRLDFDKTKPASTGGKTGPMSVTMQKELLESDDVSQSSAAVIRTLEAAKAKNKDAYSGYLAKPRAVLASNLPGNTPGADATIDLDNMMTGQALESLKLIFGGMPTEGERKILLDMQASADKTPKQREAIMDRAIAAAKVRGDFAKSKAKSIREGTYLTEGVPESSGTPQRTVVRTGVMGGKKVVQYSDGTTEYAN